MDLMCCFLSQSLATCLLIVNLDPSPDSSLPWLEKHSTPDTSMHNKEGKCVFSCVKVARGLRTYLNERASTNGWLTTALLWYESNHTCFTLVFCNSRALMGAITHSSLLNPSETVYGSVASSDPCASLYAPIGSVRASKQRCYICLIQNMWPVRPQLSPDLSHTALWPSSLLVSSLGKSTNWQQGLPKVHRSPQDHCQHVHRLRWTQRHKQKHILSLCSVQT